MDLQCPLFADFSGPAQQQGSQSKSTRGAPGLEINVGGLEEGQAE